MTVYNFTNGTIDGQMIPPDMEILTDRPTILRNILDFSKQDLEAGVPDSAIALNVPAGTLVLECGLRIITAETGDGTVDLGITGGNVDQWGDALAVDTAAGAMLNIAAVPVFFADAGTIQILATTDTADIDIDGLKCEVWALCMKMVDVY